MTCEPMNYEVVSCYLTFHVVRRSADYQDIDPRYGTLEDWDRLAEAMHARGMKIMSVILSLALSMNPE